MLFKFKIIPGLLIFLWLIFLSASGQSVEVEDADWNGYPLGFIVRPSLIENLLKSLISNPESNAQKYELHFCFKNPLYPVGSEKLSFVGNLDLQWTKPRWEPTSPTSIAVVLNIQHLLLKGGLLEGCIDEDLQSRQPSRISEIKFDEDFPIRLMFQPELLKTNRSPAASVRIEDLGRIARHFALKRSDKFPTTRTSTFEDVLSNPAMIEALLDGATREMSTWLSNWISERLRGLVMVQTMKEMLQNSFLYQTGPLVERKALSIELEPKKKSELEASFVWFPYAEPYAFSSAQGLEIFVNAIFKSLKSLDLTRSFLSEERTRPALHFSKPIFAAVPYDFTLVAHTKLINAALLLWYRDGLLRFITRIALGKQTAGQIAREAEDVETIIHLAPESAPQMEFSFNQSELQVKDYVVAVETHLEDRYIPEARIRANVSIGTSLGVDKNGQHVVLRMDPDSFLLTQTEDTKNGKLAPRLSKDDLDLFKRIADGLWKNYLKTYPELPLFQTLIELEKTRLKIKEVKVEGDYVLLHMNLDDSPRESGK